MNLLARAMESMGGRRFLLTLGSGLATTALQWFGKIGDGSTYATVVIATVGAYIAGNTTQKVKAGQEPAP